MFRLTILDMLLTPWKRALLIKELKQITKKKELWITAQESTVK